RRPINLNNYYNQRQIKIFAKNEDFSNIPSFDDVFRDESDSDVDESVTTEEILEKRIARREWQKNKQEIVIDYEAFSYFSVSSAIVLYDVCYKLSSDDMQLLWFAIVAHTSLLVCGQNSQDAYIDQIEYLQNHVTRLTNALNLQQHTADENSPRLSITFEEELALWLYRHWNLRSVLETTMLTASKFKLFTERGTKRLDEFLAHMGLSKRVCEQRFSTMQNDIRQQLHSLFSQHIEKFGLSKTDLFFPSFNLKAGFKSQFNAMDSVLLLISILEFSTQLNLKVINQQARALLNTDELIVFGPFLYVHVVRDSLLTAGLRNDMGSCILAKYILTAKASVRSKLGAGKRTAQMPLILCIDALIPKDAPERNEPDDDYLMLLGIPPLLGDDDRNLFGQAFEVAAKKTKCRVRFRYFDTNRIDLHREDLLNLFEALVVLLT
ncbi:DNA replication initiation factor cdc45, partial [Cichlidogyrus casuarinus]